MLVEIRCDQFTQNSIPFKAGLNVVLGDDNGSNSIGKTSLLLVIDFVFGGGSLIEKKEDIVKELGHHDYRFTFEFKNDSFVFRRGTNSPNIVYEFNVEEKNFEAKTVEEYRAFLCKMYGLVDKYTSFRQVVGLYSRIWGKDNLNTNKPLHTVPEVSPRKCVVDLIQLFRKYDALAEIDLKLKDSSELQAAMNKAYKKNIIQEINKSTYVENVQLVENIGAEISDITNNLSKYMVNISELLNREMLELSAEKDKLLENRLNVSNRLNRVRENLQGNRKINSKSFEALRKFIPTVDVEKILHVEEFHSDIVKLLRSELRASEKNLAAQLETVDSEISRIDTELSEALTFTDAPKAVVERIMDLTKLKESSVNENKHYDESKAIKKEKSSLVEEQATATLKILKNIEILINDRLKELVTGIFGSDRKSPTIRLGASNYKFEVYEDTGTGTAYNALVLFDLAILELTMLPILIHDSVLFKNIENDSLAEIFSAYVSSKKQTFIAIDERKKYGAKAAAILSANCAISLDKNTLLYLKDWRTQSS